MRHFTEKAARNERGHTGLNPLGWPPSPRAPPVFSVGDGFSSVLGSLEPRPLTQKQSRPKPGTTGAWLTHIHGPPTSPENASYRRWRMSQSGEALWVCGAPGTGKSSLAQLLVQHMQSDDRNVVLSFGFNASNGPMANTPTELLKSILGELILHLDNGFSMDDGRFAVDSFLEQRGLILQPWEPTLEETLWEIFENLVCRQDSCFLIIDALDECTSAGKAKDSAVPGAAGLMRELIDLTKRSKLKLACFSRDEPKLGHLMQESMSIKLTANLVMADVLTCFLQEYDRDPALPARSRERAKRRVLETADGSFLWAKVLVQYARSVENDAAIDLRLEICPPRLHDAYERMLLETSRLGDFGDVETGLQRAVFAMLLGAQAPVTLAMVVDALGVSEHDAEARIRLLCRPLVNVSGARVELCHSSARDFLTGSRPRVTATMPPIAPVESHELLARKCLERLLRAECASCNETSNCACGQGDEPSGNVRLSRHRARRHGFYDYAADYWATHLMAVPKPSQGLLELVTSLPARRAWDNSVIGRDRG